MYFPPSVSKLNSDYNKKIDLYPLGYDTWIDGEADFNSFIYPGRYYGNAYLSNMKNYPFWDSNGSTIYLIVDAPWDGVIIQTCYIRTDNNIDNIFSMYTRSVKADNWTPWVKL